MLRRLVVNLLLGVLAVGFVAAMLTVGMEIARSQPVDVPPERHYHAVAIPSLAGGHVRATHVEVEGYVTYVRTEADGDLHIRLCDSPRVKGMNRLRCIVAECIPAMPCPAPDLGQKVAVHGISRYDHERGHQWFEVHPVERGFW